jgi:hypothetical protein
MSAPDLQQELPPDPPGELQALMLLVSSARQQSERQRQPGATPDRVLSTRLALLEALQSYTEALQRRRLPVPRLMDTEMRLLRGLCGVGTRRPPERR